MPSPVAYPAAVADSGGSWLIQASFDLVQALFEETGAQCSNVEVAPTQMLLYGGHAGFQIASVR